ncbi:histidine-rich glycoprotein-like [Galendromus occidentalis]|uniref:Histidine-rich glycoprotein-like n=1 Tax=Galendromus occidentalis TaxID=34638 RepID=A0AAJ7SG34_9ACAR|nr:histidine-rich glycoprotein-like [Galendromus occidentalis]
MMSFFPCVVIAAVVALLQAVALSSVDHTHNPYREGGYYHFDHQGIPHWHSGKYHYHGYDEYIYRSPKYVRYVSDPVVHQRLHTHVERVPTYSRTYEVPTNYRQVDHQHHHADERTIVEKKIYKQEVTPAHYHVGATHVDSDHHHHLH